MIEKLERNSASIVKACGRPTCCLAQLADCRFSGGIFVNAVGLALNKILCLPTLH